MGVCVCMQGLCESLGEYVCVNVIAYVYTLVGECVSCETLDGDAGSSISCAAGLVAQLLCVRGGRLPLQNTPGPGCDSTHHRVEQRSPGLQAFPILCSQLQHHVAGG